jgi:predicted dinucleotide-binding enzyme
VEEVIATYAHLLDHTIILDAANKYRNGSNRNYANHNPQWNEPELNSLSFIQTHIPHAHAYRAFNSYSIHPFADPIYQGVQADLFYCGPAGLEKAIVEQLIAEIGLRPIYLGESNMVEVVDGVIRLWAALAFFQDMGVNQVAFKVLTR